MAARNSGPSSSHESSERFEESGGAANARDRIVPLVRASEHAGIFQRAVADQLPEFRSHSITPRFVELEKLDLIARVQTGVGKPTRMFPEGKPRYAQTIDPQTGCPVCLYWTPEFLPTVVEWFARKAIADGQPALSFSEQDVEDEDFLDEDNAETSFLLDENGDQLQ
jgi:hypothetical protein